MIEVTTDHHNNFGDNKKIWLNIDYVSSVIKLDTGETFIGAQDIGVILCKETVDEVVAKIAQARAKRSQQ